jgi:NAD(P)-dependent dehydrogenase (short-subunit alcohol dehydrogenase family)
MNKIALVTGGSRGLGKEMALSLAKSGLDVLITYRSNEIKATEVIREIKDYGGQGYAFQLDISNMDSISQFVSELKRILAGKFKTEKLNYLVNNAGSGEIGAIAEMDEPAFDHLINTNFKGVFFLTQKIIPLLNKQGGVVFVTSGTTRFTVPGYSVYAAVKSAMEVFSRYVAKEYGDQGIRSNVIAPGPVETDLMIKTFEENPQLKTMLAAQTALKRIGQTDDIGSVVSFLCSDDSKWVNAQRIEVSGGLLI